MLKYKKLFNVISNVVKQLSSGGAAAPLAVSTPSCCSTLPQQWTQPQSRGVDMCLSWEHSSTFRNNSSNSNAIKHWRYKNVVT